MGRLKLMLVGAAAALSLLSFALTADAQDKPPVKIALSTPLSGPLGPAAKVQVIAVKLGVEDINKAGGVNGSKVELSVYDDAFDPAQGLLRIREAMAAGAVVIIGPYSSTQWETAAPVLNQLKMPGLNASATKPGINVPPYAMRMSQPDDKGMPGSFAAFKRAYPNVKRVVVVGDVREASGKAAIDRWVELAKSAGLEVADTITYTTAQTDMSSMAIRIKSLAPDALLVGMLPNDALKFANELHIQEIKVPTLANAMLYSGVFPQLASQNVGADAGLWHVVGFSTNDSATGADPARYKAFVDRYIAEVNKDSALAQFQPPNVANSHLGYDGVMMLAELLRKAGVDGNTPIAQAREKLHEQMVKVREYHGLNDFVFDEKGEGAPRAMLIRIDPNQRRYVVVGK